MAYKLIVLSLFLLIIGTHQEDQLKQVYQFFRHGARSHFNNLTSSKFNIPFGELTNVGMRQHYLLGQKMRQKYILEKKFLSHSFNSNEMYIRSTNFNRTIQSCQSHLLGLYPPGTGPKIHKKLQSIALPPYIGQYNFKRLKNQALPNFFQSIPIHIINDQNDIFIGWDCSKLQELFQEQINSSYVRNIMKQFNTTVQTLLKAVKYNSTKELNFYDFYSIYDNLYCDSFYGIPTPKFDKETQKNLTYLYSLEYHIDWYSTKEQIQLVNSPVMIELLKFMNDKISNQNSSLKWITYSAHDSTIAQLSAGFNFTNKKCISELFYKGKTDALNCVNKFPTYATQILIELYQKENTSGKSKADYYIKINYNGQYMNLCEKKSHNCQFDEFESRIQDQILVDYRGICSKSNLKNNLRFLQQEISFLQK